MLDAISLVAVLGSVLLLAWQTHSLARQLRLQTQTTLATAGDTAMQLLQNVLLALLERPHLRPYFYDGMDGIGDAEVDAIAELLADAVNYGCEVGEEIPLAAQSVSGFPDYGVFLLSQSPVMHRLVTAQPVWYPALAKLLPSAKVAAGPMRHSPMPPQDTQVT